MHAGIAFGSLVAALTLGCAHARADKVPPPPAPHITVTRVAAELCGQGEKDIPCARTVIAATATAAVEIEHALAKTPIVCRGEKAGKHAIHLYWGDGFGTVVHIDFDQQSAGLPDCAGDLVQVVTDRLTPAIKPFGDRDETLRVHWTVDFTLER